MRSGRIDRVLASIIATMATLAVIATTPATSAQTATPVAAPMPGGVACTDLFGISLGNACVLVLHGSSDAGPVDVYIDGEIAIEGATFGVLGDFVPVAAGEHQVQIVASGDALENALIEDAMDLADGVAYEVAVVGAADAVRLQTLPVDTRPLPENGSRLRVVHASPDAPAIDVAVTGGDTVIENLDSGKVSAYTELTSGTYDLEVRIAGTADLALPLPGTVLAPNTVYSVYVTGLVDEGSLGATLVPVLVSPDIAAATPVA